MSQLYVDNIKNRTGGSVGFPTGIVVTGVATATQFSGNIIGTTATFSGNVSVGGTLSYEDVTNVDSVGLITARSGIEISGIVTARAGSAVTFYGDGSGLTGVSSWDSYDSWLFGGGG
jgi:hypothetical protein